MPCWGVALSKQRKAYVGILVAAVGALAVDQVFLQGGGAPAPAAASAAGAPAAPSDVSIPATIPGKAARSLGELAERIERLRVSLEGGARPEGHEGEAFAVSDAFILPAGWRPPVPAPEVKVAVEAPKAEKRTAETVRAALHLTATVTGQSPLAVVTLKSEKSEKPGSRMCKIGEEVEGCVVREIRSNAIVVELLETGELIEIAVDKRTEKSDTQLIPGGETGAKGVEQGSAPEGDKKAKTESVGG